MARALLFIPQNATISSGVLGTIIAIGVIFLLSGIWVIFTYARNKALRAYPAVLVLSKTLCNLCFGLILFGQMIWVPEGGTANCSWVGGLWLVFSIASDCYYAALAYDLYATLSNPFRHVADSIRTIHVAVWTVSISLCVGLGAAGQFDFRPSFGICATKTTDSFSDFNVANALVLYIPNGFSNFFGVAALIYAVRRMNVGLDASWELRQKVITEMLILVVTYGVDSLIILVAWIVAVYVPTVNNPGHPNTSTNTFILLTTTLPSRTLADAVAWFFLKYFNGCKESYGLCQNSCNCIEQWKSTEEDKLAFHRTFIELEPEEHVSVALRQEVIEYMKVGIATTLERAASRTRRATVQRSQRKLLPDDEIDEKEEPTEPMPTPDRYPQGMEDRSEKTVDVFDIATKEENSTEVPFVDYAPHVFRYLRKHVYHKSDVEYRISIDEGEADNIARTNFVDGGRSGAFLFFTGDSQHLIKTLTTDELKFCLKILPDYVEHLSKHSGKTLITKFYGLHSLEMYDIRIHFIVMDNVFVSGKAPDQKYDLKGSWIARHTNHHVEAGKLMKDEDFRTVLRLEETVALDLYKTMKYDSEFLASQNIMDYSLLLGMYYEDVERLPPMPLSAGSIPEDEDDVVNDASRMRFDSATVRVVEMQQMVALSQSQTQIVLTPGADQKKSKLEAEDFEHTDEARVFRAPRIYGPGTYCMGIIDILAEYGLFKRAERFAKTYFLCNDPNGISVNPPERYQQRFLEFMGRRVLGLSAEQMEEME